MKFCSSGWKVIQIDESFEIPKIKFKKIEILKFRVAFK